MKELKRVSRWITIKHDYVTKRHSLYGYADGEDEYAHLSWFRWNGRRYAINQFLSRFGMMGFDPNFKEYPPYITGYDSERYFNNLYCELDEYCERIRLYIEV